MDDTLFRVVNCHVFNLNFVAKIRRIIGMAKIVSDRELGGEAAHGAAHQRQADAEGQHFGDGHAEPYARPAYEGSEREHGQQHEDDAAAYRYHHRLARSRDGRVEAACHDVDERDQIMQRYVGGRLGGHLMQFHVARGEGAGNALLEH